ncbi:ABC transporter substrate-binding protein [Rhodovarius crocodyli]|uniref:ABC transporter substrate-binding protein n=1 Tax=Rhodovarius crocodyli TaxID=1979269 RepID=A0A437MMU8_9PROT|nr:TRAP transporter substrate-binding protein [Rhodovarius crocodyli]RVT98969.1 ABC transporter substrate-binding protein [Rhodovarius crocodyli]
MQRRSVLQQSLMAGAGAATLASPALAQSNPAIRWRMTSSFTRVLDVTYGAADYFCRRVSELTDGQFQIQQFAAGEIVGGLQALDAVQQGSVEAAATGALFFIGKDPTFALAAATPFMLNPRQQHAWLWQQGGNEMLNEFFANYNVVAFPFGQTGNQWGGWFRNEIRTVENLRGLKMRVAGLAGNVMQKLGTVPQQIAPGDIYPALERGVIDAVEYIGPHDDEKLGLNRVARYYYYPGWGEGGTVFHGMFNKEKYEALPRLYKTAIAVASEASTLMMMSAYDTKNPDALMRLLASGTQLRAFPNDVLAALYRSTEEMYNEISATNANFKKILEAQIAVRDRNYAYHQVADFQFDAMMLRLRRR